MDELQNNLIEKDKIYVIFGEVKDDDVLRDGQLEIIRGNDAESHAYYLVEFLKDHFTDIEFFKQFNKRITIDVMSHFLAVRTDCVTFFNTTKDIDRYGQTGFFVMPPYLTDSQRKTIEMLIPKLEEFTSIEISYDTHYDDGFIEYKSMSTGHDFNVRDLFNRYYNKIEEANNKKTK